MSTERLLHPNVHPAWSKWSEDQTLHVIAPYFNPFRFRTRRELFQNFAIQMEHAPNVAFWPIEIAFGARPHEVTDPTNPRHTQLRTNSVLWYKENQINIQMAKIVSLVPGARYFSYYDADVSTTRHDWALEAIHQLQHYDWVQLFNYFTFESRDHLPVHQHPSFAYVYHEYTDLATDAPRLETLQNVPSETGASTTKKPSANVAAEHGHPKAPPNAVPPHDHGSVPPNAVDGATPYTGTKDSVLKRRRSLRWPGAPGLGWSWTRSGFDRVGGLLDICVLGSADWHMALGLTGDEEQRTEVHSSEGYLNGIGFWQKRAYQSTRGRIGYVANSLVHHWHGDHRNRQYGTRWEILHRNAFDPRFDIVKDSQGLYQYAGNKPHLEREIYRYFLDRDDDSTELSKQPTL